MSRTSSGDRGASRPGLDTTGRIPLQRSTRRIDLGRGHAPTTQIGIRGRRAMSRTWPGAISSSYRGPWCCSSPRQRASMMSRPSSRSVARAARSATSRRSPMPLSAQPRPPRGRLGHWKAHRGSRPDSPPSTADAKEAASTWSPTRSSRYASPSRRATTTRPRRRRLPTRRRHPTPLPQPTPLARAARPLTLPEAQNQTSHPEHVTRRRPGVLGHVEFTVKPWFGDT